MLELILYKLCQVHNALRKANISIQKICVFTECCQKFQFIAKTFNFNSFKTDNHLLEVQYSHNL